MSKYPQHDKVRALEGENQTIGDFIEWMKGRYSLCKYDDEYREFFQVHISTEKLLAKYFDIDLKAHAAEKDAMLAEIRGAGK